MLSQQLQDQLQTQYSAVIDNYIMDRHNIRPRVNYRSALMQKKKQTKMIGNGNCELRNKNIIIMIAIISLN
jgi:hypothetical protein